MAPGRASNSSPPRAARPRRQWLAPFLALLAGLALAPALTLAASDPPPTSPQAEAVPVPVAPAPSAAPPLQPGGFGPFLQSCLCGPRIGLEANEGKPLTGAEALNGFLRVVVPLQALGQYGVGACFASLCIGPRVGMQLHERRIRTIEWMRLVPVVNVYAAVVNGFEAAEGRTMSEIAEGEGLDEPRPPRTP